MKVKKLDKRLNCRANGRTNKMNEFNMLDVKSIKTITRNHGDFVVKKLVVTNSDGSETTINLFSDNKDNLKISSPKFKDVK